MAAVAVEGPKRRGRPPGSKNKPTTPVKSPMAASAAEPKRRGRKPGSEVRWSFKPGASYRIVGDSPFRDGNNATLFSHLVGLYGSTAFSVEDANRAIAQLRTHGKFTSEMDDHRSVVAFVRLAGAKDRIEMASELPQAQAGTGRPAPAAGAPPTHGRTIKVKRRTGRL